MQIGDSVQLICLFSLNTALLIATLTSSHPDLKECSQWLPFVMSFFLWVEEHLPAHGRASTLT